MVFASGEVATAIGGHQLGHCVRESALQFVDGPGGGQMQ
jgi:hypothetical protein